MNRSVRAVAVMILAAVTMAALPSCRPGEPAAADLSAGPSRVAAEPKVSAKPSIAFSGPAVDRYGQARLQAEFRDLLAFTFDNGWNAKLIRTAARSVRRSDLTGMLAAMSPTCAATFTAAFAKLAAHDQATIRTLQAATFFGITGANGARPITGVGLVTNRTYTSPTIELDPAGGGRLTIAFTAKAVLHLQDGAGHRYRLPTARAERYRLLPNLGRNAVALPFLIDAWQNHLTVAKLSLE